MMRATTSLCSLFLLSLISYPSCAGAVKTWLDKYDGSPHPSAIVLAGNARFTVLTEAVIRMEYSAAKAFDDTPTVNILNRRTKTVPAYTVTREPGRPWIVTISTSAVELRYDGQKDEEQATHDNDNDNGIPRTFTPENLQVKLKRFPYTVWRSGAVGSGNLHGTIRTLDRVGESVDLTCLTPRDTMTFYAHCEEGLVSKDGWVLVDDSLRPRFDTNTDPSVVRKSPHTRHSDPEWPWMTSPPPHNIEALLAGLPALPYTDTYFFGHGRNYTESLRDYVTLAGPIPLLPRYALGPGFSRWYAWGQEEEVSAVINEGFAAHGIPMDGLSVDMDFHYTFPHGLPNQYNVKIEGWTGYTPYPPLFPDLPSFFAHTRRRGVYVNFNMHPAAGVEFHEATYPQIAREVGIDPNTGATVEFDISNQTYAIGLFKHVLKPLDDAGLDYYWIDFQHGPFTPVRMLNPTFACNYAWWTNPWRYGHRVGEQYAGANGEAGARGKDRPFIMGRWGGLGGHRYPVGFAGDTAVKWRVLRYETYFSPTSSNVAFMWTHDVGGFEGDPPAELLTRWVQWGTFSAMLRTHSSKMSPARSIWHYPNPFFSIMRTFYRLRAALVPYIATSQRLSYETGQQLLRPMYWSYPYSPAAYGDQALHQYFFGPDIWVAPIASPVSSDGSSLMLGSAPISQLQMRTGSTGKKFEAAKSQMHGLATWTLWVPPGEWIEWFSWQTLSGASDRAATPDAPEGTPGGAGSFISRNYTIGEMPIFSAPGTIIPMRILPDSTSGSSVLGLATKQVKDVGVWVMPITEGSGLGSASSSSTSGSSSITRRTRLYDDDGLSTDYEDGAYYWTELECKWSRVSGVDSIKCVVHAAGGEGKGYPTFPSTRTYSFRFIGSWPPSSVKINGESVTRDQPAMPDNMGEHSMWNAGVNAWAYHGSSLSTWVRAGTPLSTSSSHTIEISFPPGAAIDDKVLTSGFSRKVARSLVCKDDVDRHYGLVYPSDVDSVLNVSAAASRLSAAAASTTSPSAAAAAKSILKHAEEDLVNSVQRITTWQVPESYTVALALQAHCLGQIQDAITIPAPLPANHPRAAAAAGPIKFRADIAASKGSAPGQTSQYSGGGEDDDDVAIEVGVGG